MTIFNSYVKLPEGILLYGHVSPKPIPQVGMNHTWLGQKAGPEMSWIQMDPAAAYADLTWLLRSFRKSSLVRKWGYNLQKKTRGSSSRDRLTVRWVGWSSIVSRTPLWSCIIWDIYKLYKCCWCHIKSDLVNHSEPNSIKRSFWSYHLTSSCGSSPIFCNSASELFSCAMAM